MGQLVSDAESASLVTWAAAQRRAGPRRFRVEPGGLRFAFYGRISTTDHQDYGSSRHWQLSAATELIAGHGDIAAEYFDAGVSRRDCMVRPGRGGTAADRHPGRRPGL